MARDLDADRTPNGSDSSPRFGSPPWAAESEFQTMYHEDAQHRELDENVARWAAERQRRRRDGDLAARARRRGRPRTAPTLRARSATAIARLLAERRDPTAQRPR